MKKQVLLDATGASVWPMKKRNACLPCHGRVNQTAAGGYQDMVQAQQYAIAALAGLIAEDTRD
jgi:uncharacterized lipoprotein YmbA